jgi:hypothetical protein
MALSCYYKAQDLAESIDSQLLVKKVQQFINSL